MMYHLLSSKHVCYIILVHFYIHVLLTTEKYYFSFNFLQLDCELFKEWESIVSFLMVD